MKKLRLFLLYIFLCSTSALFSQQKLEVTGKVIDETGQGLPGVNIVIKGTKKATISNSEGMYKIEVEKNEATFLVYTFLGMKSKTEAVGTRKVINVLLESDAKQLNEVVAVGYGNMRRKDITGSVVSVDANEMAKVPTSNVAQALAGRVSGVMVSQSEGSPDASIAIRVRGGISITGNNEPLYIIDGFPTENGLSSIDPGSIESIDILKDASSTAIYGARGANGVVVVTTKSGTPSKTTVSYEGYFGAKQLAKNIDVLSPYEFVKLNYERCSTQQDYDAFPKIYGPIADISTNYANRKGVNWMDEGFGNTAYTQNHRVSIDGGAGKLRYNLSYSNNKEDGQMVNSGLSKDNFRMKIDHQVNDRFKATATASYTTSEVYGMSTSSQSTTFNYLNQLLQYRPTIGINGSDENLITQLFDPYNLDLNGNLIQNPVMSTSLQDIINNQRILQLNGGFSYKIMKGVTFANTIGTSYQLQRRSEFYKANSITALRGSIQGFIRNTESQTTQTSNTLTYEGSSKKHKYNFMIGQEFVTNWSRFLETSGSNFPNDDIGLNDFSLAGTIGIPKSNYIPDVNLLSFFARAYYNYADKYMLTVTARADGSSKLGKKWGYFPSASFAWRASQEKFIKNLDIFSDLKVRLGYGLAGNNRINSYSSLPLLGSVTAPSGTITTPGYAPTQIPNPSLQWEANQTLNIGLDLGFFNQRLIISPEIYVNRSSQLLLNATLPQSSGYSNMIQNVGRTENRGFDITVTSVNVKKRNFEWTTNFNISHNQNKIIALAGEQSFEQESGFGFNRTDFLVKVGDPIGQIIGYKIIGLYQTSDFDYNSTTKTYTLKPGIPYLPGRIPQPGFWKYEDNPATTNVDSKGNPIINDADRTILGNTVPKIYGGMNNTLTFKNLDLSIFVNFSLGNDVLNATKMYNSMSKSNMNSLNIVNSANRWMTIDDQGNRVTDPDLLNQMNAGKTIASYANISASDNLITSYGVEDGSFLRINNITLGYSFPKKILKKLGLTKLRVYSTANNLYTFTNYTGFDPEVSTRNATGLTPGVDSSAYPRSRTLTVGLNVNF